MRLLNSIYVDQNAGSLTWPSAVLIFPIFHPRLHIMGWKSQYSEVFLTVISSSVEMASQTLKYVLLAPGCNVIQ